MVCSIYPTDPLLLELTVSQMENTITELQENNTITYGPCRPVRGAAPESKETRTCTHVWTHILLKLAVTTPPTV